MYQTLNQKQINSTKLFYYDYSRWLKNSPDYLINLLILWIFKKLRSFIQGSTQRDVDRIYRLLAESSAVSKEVMLQSLIDKGSMALLGYNEQKFHSRIKTRTEFIRAFLLMCHLCQAT